MNDEQLRPGRRADLATIAELHNEMSERDGTSYPLPELFAKDMIPRVPIVLVVERDEAVVGALYVDTAAELCFAGCDPKATAVARRDIEALAWALRQHGFTHLRCLVPAVQVEAIRKPLERSGFRERADLVCFTRSLQVSSHDDGEESDEPER